MSPADASRTWFVLASMVAYFVACVVNSLRAGGWRPLSIATAACLLAFGAYAAWARDAAMALYIVFGLVAGACELPIDAWLVRRTKTLVYPPGEPMIWASPAYMPFAWAVVLVQVCVLGDALVPDSRTPAHSVLVAPVSSVLVALVSGLYIPVYEHLAKGARLWWYRDTPMLFAAPYYVILSEFLLGLPLVAMGLKAEHTRLTPGSVVAIAALGAAEGLVVMSAACVVSFAICGRPRSPAPPASD